MNKPAGTVADQKIGLRPIVELEWTSPVPGRKALKKLNGILSTIDHDALGLTERGIMPDVWRKPSFHTAIVVAILHALGWPCRWRAIPDYDQFNDAIYASEWDGWTLDVDAIERAALDAISWNMSNPDRLRSVAPWDVRCLRGLSRSIDKYLPAAAPWPSRGARRFGRRRCVKRFRTPRRIL